jgi:hypothetical protein
MLRVQRDDSESEEERCRPDDEVRKIDAHAHAHLFAVNATRETRHVERQRIYRHNSIQRFHEIFSARPINICARAVNAVR